MSLVRSDKVVENDTGVVGNIEMTTTTTTTMMNSYGHKRFVNAGLSEQLSVELSSTPNKRSKTTTTTTTTSSNSPRASVSPTSLTSISSSSPSHHSSSNTISNMVQNTPLPQMSAANANSLLSFLFTSAAAAAATGNITPPQQQQQQQHNHMNSNNTNANNSHSSTPTSINKSLECVESSVTYVDTSPDSSSSSSGMSETIKLNGNKFAITMASNMRSYVQTHVPPDTLLKFANNADVTLIAHKLLLYNASPFFRRKYNEAVCQNGIYILKMDANFCTTSVQTCLEYIYSMGLGDLDLGARGSLVSLKHTAQCLELTDLARLVDMLIEREPLLQCQLANNSTNQHTNHHHQVAQQQLNQIYTNLMIEQILKKLCNSNTSSNNEQQQTTNENKTVMTTVATTTTKTTNDEIITNTRFMSLFNRSRIDLSRFENDFELDTISRDLVIKEKYVYPSQDLTPNFLDACFENSVLINLDRNETDSSQISNEFQRHALIIFSINLDTSTVTPSSSACATPTASTSPVGCGLGTSSSQQQSRTSSPSATTSHHSTTHHHHNSTSTSTPTTISPTTSSSSSLSSTTSPTSSSTLSSSSIEARAFKLQNFVIKARLNFTELSLLKEDISRLFEQFLNQVLVKSLNMNTGNSSSSYRCVVNRVCYLKKPSNCKTIRVETIKSSTDCLRAIVEYSRLNETTRELPYVFLTTHSSVYVV